MPDTAVIENEDALAADFDEAGEEEERPQTFAELGVPGPLVHALADEGKRTAFPIQQDTLPDSLAGRDVLGRGRTGSGKTLAFTLPLVTRLGDVTYDDGVSMEDFRSAVRKAQRDRVKALRHSDATPHPRGLILAPTRELANQINDVVAPLAHVYGMTTTTVYGGVRYSRQINDLKAGADIVVACPGRLEDLIEQGALTLDDVRVVVLDEAYMDFWNESMLGEFENYDNLLILKTCSKAFGLAALRVGFAVGNEKLVRAIKAVKSPYNVNTCSQKMAEAVLKNRAEADAAIRRLLLSRDELQQKFDRMAQRFPEKLQTVKSVTNFVVLRTPYAKELYERLLAESIAVRYFKNMSALRITAGSTGENAVVTEHIQRFFEEKEQA